MAKTSHDHQIKAELHSQTIACGIYGVNADSEYTMSFLYAPTAGRPCHLSQTLQGHLYVLPLESCWDRLLEESLCGARCNTVEMPSSMVDMAALARRLDGES